MLFFDDFERSSLETGRMASIPTFTAADDVLKGSQTREDHGIVGGIRVDMTRVAAAFTFKNSFHLTANGKDALFDDVRVWATAK